MRGAIVMVTVGVSLMLAVPADAQEQPPTATVSNGAETAAATLSSGCKTQAGPTGQPEATLCADVGFPPQQFSELRVESGAVVIRTSGPMTLSPNVVLRTRDAAQPGPLATLAPVQRDAQSWEVALPRITAPSFLTFDGAWTATQASGTQAYVVGLLPERPASAVKFVKRSWIERRVALSGTAHVDAESVTVRLSCRDVTVSKQVAVRGGAWSTVLRAPKRCASSPRGSTAASIAGTERVKASRVSARLRHVMRGK